MTWSISIASLNDGAPEPFSSLFCSKLTRHLKSQAAGTFSFTETAGRMDQGALGNNLDPCVIRGINPAGEPIVYFQGRLSSIPRVGAPAGEERRYVVSDAWLDFERITYQQQWNVITGVDEEGNPTVAGEYRSEALLGIDLEGNVHTSDWAITDVVNWAIARGANVQLGTILRDAGGNSTAAPVPIKEIKDLPCSVVLQELLRLTPDAVTWFDYSTTLNGAPCPTFNVTRRADCPGMTVGLAGEPEDIELTPRYDLVRSQVVIRYLQENTTDGIPSLNVIVDAAPGGADGLAYDALVSTVRLAGGNATFQKQPVQVTPILAVPAADDDQGAYIQWWQKQVPWLAAFSADRLQIEEGATGFVVDGQSNDDGTPVETNIGDFPNQITRGAVADWMNVHSATLSFQATFTYNYPDTADAESKAALKVFGGSQDGTDATATGLGNSVGVTATLAGTDAVTQTYKQLSSYEEPERVPSGFAAVLYQALSVLHYDGSYAILGSEVAPGNRLGIVLNITGSQQAWSTMNALVQEIVDDLDEGRTTWKVGPPGHLTIQDLMEQLRYTRTRVPSRHIKERETGQPSDPTVNGASHPPNDSGGGAPSAGLELPWCDFIPEQNTGDGGDPPATWDVLFGYGNSSFAGPDGIDHAAPVERMEIDAGNTGNAWDGSDHPETDDTWGFSLVCGDQTPSQDHLYHAAYGGSYKLSPDGGSFYLCNGFNPDDSADQFINIDRNNLVVEMQDTELSYIKLNLSGSPLIELGVDGTLASILSDTNLSLDYGDVTLSTAGLAIDNTDYETTANLYMTGDFAQLLLTDGEGYEASYGSNGMSVTSENGDGAELDPGYLSLSTYGGGITLDVSLVNGHSMYVQSVACPWSPGNSVNILCSDPY